MTQNRYIAMGIVVTCLLSLAACGGGGGRWFQAYHRNSDS